MDDVNPKYGDIKIMVRDFIDKTGQEKVYDDLGILKKFYSKKEEIVKSQILLNPIDWMFKSSQKPYMFL